MKVDKSLSLGISAVQVNLLKLHSLYSMRRQYDTPYGSQLKLLKVLKPLLQGDQLKVLKKQQPAYVTEWNAVLLPTGKVFVCGGQMKSPSSKQMEAVPLPGSLIPRQVTYREGPHTLVARDRSSSVTLLQDGRVQTVTGGLICHPMEQVLLQSQYP